MECILMFGKQQWIKMASKNFKNQKFPLRDLKKYYCFLFKTQRLLLCDLFNLLNLYFCINPLTADNFIITSV